MSIILRNAYMDLYLVDIFSDMTHCSEGVPRLGRIGLLQLLFIDFSSILCHSHHCTSKSYGPSMDCGEKQLVPS